MALVSVLLIIIGFILSVYAGIVLSLRNKVLTPSGELNNSRINLFAVLMALSVIMVLAGTIGYYFLRGNLPYYFGH